MGASEAEIRQPRADDGAIEVSPSALAVALLYIRAEKETAIDNQDLEVVTTWRDIEKKVMSAIGGLGLARP